MYIVFSMYDFILISSVLLENYVMSRIVSTQSSRAITFKQKRKKREKAFFEMVDNLEVDENMVYIPGQSSLEQPKTNREISSLDKEGIELIDTLTSEFGVPDDDEYQALWEEEDGFIIEDEEDDLLSIHDVNNSSLTEEFDPMEYDVNFISKIRDKKEGLQKWMVQVIGKESNFIHVTDSMRLWIKMEKSHIQKIEIGDVLEIEVEVNDDVVTVLNFNKINLDVSEDYTIPSEEKYLNDYAI